MRIRQEVELTPYEIAEIKYAYNLWGSLENGDDPAYEHLINATRVAIRDELTEIQRTYLMEYYQDKLLMREIAERHGVNTATVSRSIQKSEQQLKAVLRYAHPRLLNV